MKDQRRCARGRTGTRSRPWRWGEHPAAPTDGMPSVQQGLALTLQPTPTLDLQTQPGLRNDEVTLWEPGSVSVTCEHSPPGAGTEPGRQQGSAQQGGEAVLLACCCALVLVGGALRNRAGVRLSGEWRSGSGKGGLQTLAALKPGEEVSSQQRRALRSVYGCEETGATSHTWQSACACVCVLSHVWLCDPVDRSPPGSSVHGTPRARAAEGAAVPASGGSSREGTEPECPEAAALAGCGLFDPPRTPPDQLGSRHGPARSTGVPSIRPSASGPSCLGMPPGTGSSPPGEEGAPAARFS